MWQDSRAGMRRYVVRESQGAEQPMRYCGNCGASFDPVTLLGRVCPSCGAPINQTGDSISAQMADGPSRQISSGSDAVSLSALPTSPEHGYTDTHTHIAPPRRISRKFPAMLALIGLTLLLVGGSEILLSNATGGKVHLPGLPAGGFGGPQATDALSTSQATSAASTAGAQTGPIASPSGSPPAGTPGAGTPITGTVTPGATATVTVTPAPGQSALAVAPTSFSSLVCLGSSVQLTVTNTGEGVMSWNATASQKEYKISPQTGSLDSGQKQAVMVSSISVSGRVTITAPGAANSPQTISINCTL
jgi:hypothetical protein